MAENEALLQSNRELKAHNKELSLFNYVASHDLQEPLRKMHTFVKMIADDKDNHISGDSAIYIERILVSASRMQRLIEDLLHYSHVDTLHENGYELSDINIIVQDALTDFNETIKNTRAKVTVTTLPNIKLIPPLVYQVIHNLIGNALKYRNKDEQPILRISYELANREEIAPIEGKHEHADYYKIIIADNGIGFLQEQSELIFEPFQRLHSKDKYEGTGIGLAICKKIMTRHKGYITAQSNPGRGTKFNLYFPV
ncbi:sensor histidine kinase [Flavobacterium zepuense]|nr:ATP-binding protein [Flavobacterium zepuense]